MSCMTCRALSVCLKLQNACSLARHWQTYLARRFTCLIPWQTILFNNQVQLQSSTGGSYVEKPAETQASIWLYLLQALLLNWGWEFTGYSSIINPSWLCLYSLFFTKKVDPAGFQIILRKWNGNSPRYIYTHKILHIFLHTVLLYLIVHLQ